MNDIPTTTKRPKRRYTDEFKREAVALWRSSQASKTMVAAELGIERRLLSRWVSEQSDAIDDADAGHPSYAQLEADNRRLRLENDFLKKVSSYFAARQPGAIR